MLMADVQIRAVSKLAISVLSIFQDYLSHLWSLAANKDDGDPSKYIEMWHNIPSLLSKTSLLCKAEGADPS